MIEADFQCKTCGLPATMTRPAIDDPVRVPEQCAGCGGASFKRVFARAVIFKGSGWAGKS